MSQLLADHCCVTTSIQGYVDAGAKLPLLCMVFRAVALNIAAPFGPWFYGTDQPYFTVANPCRGRHDHSLENAVRFPKTRGEIVTRGISIRMNERLKTAVIGAESAP